MSLKDTIAADLAQIECDLDNPTFTWQGEDYFCLASSDTAGATLTEGGFELDYDLKLIVRTNQFTSGIVPLKQKELTYRNKTYRILKVSADVTGALFRIYCVSPHRIKS